MLIFLATFFCLFALYMVYQSVRPLVESAVVTSDDWQRIDDQSMALLGRRDRLLEELRDLEFEASLNKITDRDMDQLRQRYESEALAVMARLETEASDFGTRIDGDIEAVVEPARQRHAAQAPRARRGGVRPAGCSSCCWRSAGGADGWRAWAALLSA